MSEPWIGARKHPAFWLATWFGAGLMPKAPGTWGSLAALPCAWIILICPSPLALPLATLLVFGLGLWSSGIYLKKTAIHDPSSVVIDEVAGQWLALLPLGHVISPLQWLLAFALFRLFDVWKPWPIRLADRKIPGAFGVMFDDILAGGAASIIMMGVAHVSG